MLHTIHYVRGHDHWSGVDIDDYIPDEFLIKTMTHTNLSGALETAWTRAGFKFKERYGVSPDETRRTYYRVDYPSTVKYESKGREYHYKRKYTTKTYTVTVNKKIEYTRKGKRHWHLNRKGKRVYTQDIKKVSSIRKIKKQRKARYVQVYEDDHKKGRPQRVRNIPRRDIERANAMTDNDAEAYNREREGTAGFIAGNK